MPIDAALVDAVSGLVDDLATSAGRGMADAGRALGAQVDVLRRGDAGAGSVLTIELIRTLDVAEPDEEWAERSEIARLRLGPDSGELSVHVNLATMVGASQYGHVRAPDGAERADIAECVRRIRLMVADPTCRVLRVDDAGSDAVS